MEVALGVATAIAGLLGVALGRFLARRDEKQAQGERLLVEALNDVATAIATVAGGGGKEAQNRYASAVSRIALHGSPAVIAKFKVFQEDATTSTADGRGRLVAAVQEARKELGHKSAEDDDLAVLLFGSSEPATLFCPSCGTVLMSGAVRCPTCRTSVQAEDGQPGPSR